ncbi:MAG: cytochrome c-type biogenesis protein CcmH [Hyphomonadaceae bacterium]|nr:cytochrome c-type biogenesis protein CcmH [Hyphomonadaceae bacterium]
MLLRPRFAMSTLALWLAPFALLLIGASALWVLARRKAAVSDASDDDAARAALAEYKLD